MNQVKSQHVPTKFDPKEKNLTFPNFYKHFLVPLVSGGMQTSRSAASNLKLHVYFHF